MTKFVSISELCKILKLIDPKTKKPLNHVLRYWEKEFTQIKPKKINNHRYYSKKDLEIIKFIKSLIRDEKISIAGVKNILRTNAKKLDVNNNDSLKSNYIKLKLKNKSLNLLKKIRNLRKI